MTHCFAHILYSYCNCYKYVIDEAISMKRKKTNIFKKSKRDVFPSSEGCVSSDTYKTYADTLCIEPMSDKI